MVTLVLYFLHIDVRALPLTISTTFMIMARKNVSPFLANYPLHTQSHKSGLTYSFPSIVTTLQIAVKR